jgi:hypothetical protein
MTNANNAAVEAANTYLDARNALIARIVSDITANVAAIDNERIGFDAFSRRNTELWDEAIREGVSMRVSRRVSGMAARVGR